MRAYNKAIIKILQDFSYEVTGLKVDVVIDDNFYFNYIENYISIITKFKWDESEQIVHNYFNNTLKVQGLNNVFVAFLHELGHFWTKKVYKFDPQFYADDVKSKQTINNLYSNGTINYTQAMEQYYRVDGERLANEFVQMIYRNKNTKQIIKKYNKRINNILAVIDNIG